MRLFAVLLIWLGLIGGAQAQAPSFTDQNLTGTAMGSGYNLSSGPFFVLSSTSLQNMALPFSYSLSITTPAFTTGTDDWWIDAFSGTTGFGFVLDFANGNETFRAKSWIRPSNGTGQQCDAGAAGAGAVCWRPSALLDGKRHHVCGVWNTAQGKTPATGYLYIDGVLRDTTTNVGTFTPSTAFLQFGLHFPQTSGQVFNDVRFYSRALSAQECNDISRLHTQGLIPNSGTLQQGLVLSLPLNNCNTSSPPLVTCADSSGNGNSASNDKAPPTVVVTSPSAGANTGTITLQSTCTDTFACTKVCYYIDGYLEGASCPTASPYTVSFNTANLVDGSHTITAIGTNIAGVTGTSAGVVINTTGNGTAVASYYLDSVGGLDTNNCTSTGTACATVAHLLATYTFHGGDTINLKVGSTFNLGAGLNLCGAQAKLVVNTNSSSSTCTQNVYPSNLQLLITSYGGGTCNPFSGSVGALPTNCPVLNVGGTQAFSAVYDYNVGNVKIQNLALIGNTTAAKTYYGPAGVDIKSPTQIDSVVITNNYVQDFNMPFAFNASSEDGFITNFTLTNNSVDATQVVVNGKLQNGPNYGVNIRSSSWGTVQGNLIKHMSGQASQGNCIYMGNVSTANGASQHLTPGGTSTVQFNVCDTYGGANLACGGPPGIIAQEGGTAIFQFNEVARGGPFFFGQTGCDWDGFDFDFGASFATARYNYTHNNFGAGYLFCLNNSRLGGNLYSNNYYYYNISEADGNSFSECGNSNLPTVGTNVAAFNNTLYGPISTAGPTCFGNMLGINPIVVNNLCVMTDNPATTTNPAIYANFYFAQSNYASRGLIMDHNMYWATNAPYTRKYQFGHDPVSGAGNLFGPSDPNCAATNCSAIAQVASQFSVDVHSTIQNPNLTSLPTINTSSNSGLPNYATGNDECYAGVGGQPAGPQPCPSSMQLTTGSPAIGIGVNVNTAYGITNPTTDYYGTTLPNGVGTGYNIGADGAHH